MTTRGYVVICYADHYEYETPQYVIATRQLFTAEEAARYVRTIAASRQPRIITTSEYLLMQKGWREHKTLRVSEQMLRSQFYAEGKGER